MQEEFEARPTMLPMRPPSAPTNGVPLCLESEPSAKESNDENDVVETTTMTEEVACHQTHGGP